MATSRGIRSNSLELVADWLLADFCREHPDLRHRPVRGVKVVVAAYQDPSHANMKQLVNCCALPHLTPARLFSPAWTPRCAARTTNRWSSEPDPVRPTLCLTSMDPSTTDSQHRGKHAGSGAVVERRTSEVEAADKTGECATGRRVWNSGAMCSCPIDAEHWTLR